MSANWNLPVLSSLYVDVLSILKDRDIDALTLQITPGSNVPTGAFMFDRVNNYFSEFNGTVYVPKVLSIAGGGTGASSVAGAIGSFGLGTMSVQNSNAVTITGGSITGLSSLNTVNLTVTGSVVFPANSIAESMIADGALLARVASNETITGTWTFTAALTLNSSLSVLGVAGVTISGGLQVSGGAGLSVTGGKANFSGHTTHQVIIAGETHPAVVLYEINAPVNLRKWRIYNYQQILRFSGLNDAEDAITNTGMTLDRSNQLDGALLDGSDINRGTIPDARHSANVALKNINNNFVSQTLASGSSIEGDYGLLTFTDTNAGVNQKNVRIINYHDGILKLELWSDGWAGQMASWQFRRTGEFYGLHLTATGNLSVAGITNNTGLAAGTYTPAMGVVDNAVGLVYYPAQWSRVGNTVTVSGRFDCGCSTLTRAAWIRVPIPVSSTFSGGNDNAGGAIAGADGSAGRIVGGPISSGVVEFQWTPKGTGVLGLAYTYTYVIN